MKIAFIFFVMIVGTKLSFGAAQIGTAYSKYEYWFWHNVEHVQYYPQIWSGLCVDRDTDKAQPAALFIIDDGSRGKDPLRRLTGIRVWVSLAQVRFSASSNFNPEVQAVWPRLTDAEYTDLGLVSGWNDGRSSITAVRRSTAGGKDALVVVAGRDPEEGKPQYYCYFGNQLKAWPH